MMATSQCRNCGAVIRAQAPFRHCPACLLKLGFGPVPIGDPPPRSRLRAFADYELVEQIGRGGMGVVYKARQVALNRPVALKMVLAGELASPASVERFHIEAEAAASLHHPNIVPIYEIGERDGNHYFSMKLLEGESLDKMMSEFALPKAGKESLPKAVLRQAHSQIAQLIATIARAVQYAHERGILHRDLKPSNILIDSDGTPYLTDFGLAKIASRGDSVTETGTIVGTLNYMAPEQARGHKVTTAADIYSLGAILYELLAGKPPFRAETPTETLRQLADHEAPSPRLLNSFVDADLATICLKCLEKNPQGRYASAGDLADDLERWQRFEPIHAKPANTFMRVQRWTRRNRVGTALILTLCLGLGATGWLLHVVNKQKIKERLALDVVSKQKDENALLVNETLNLLRGNLEGLWASTSKRYVFIRSEQLSALVARPIVKITNEAQHVRLNVGLAAHENPVDESRRYAELFGYLEQKMSELIGREVRINLKLYKFEEERFGALKSDGLDIVRSGAYPLLTLLDSKDPVEPLVEQVSPGKLAVFFTRTNSGIRSLKDLKGRSMAFGETTATISFVAQKILAEAGITGRDLAKYAHLESATEFEEDVIASGDFEEVVKQIGILTSHSEVIERVLDGTFDAGISNLRAFQRHQRRGLVMIPGTIFENWRNTWVARADLPPETKQAFVEAMTSLRDRGILLTLPDYPTNGYRSVLTESRAPELETLRRVHTLFPRKPTVLETNQSKIIK